MRLTEPPIPTRYGAAVDVLAFMHGQDWETDLPLPDGTVWRVPPYDREALLVETDLFSTWFAGNGGEPAFPEERKEPFRQAWSDMLGRVGPETTLALRDFHSPNILWLPDARRTRPGRRHRFPGRGDGPSRLRSSPRSARTRGSTLPEELERDLIDRYVAARRAASPGFDAAGFEAAYAIFAAQRATKILGIFTRLALAEGKTTATSATAHRLKRLLARTLRHPVLSDMRVWYEPFLRDGRRCRMTMPKMAMVLAAGMGRRMRPLSALTPKPLVEVGGVALIDHCLDDLADAGVERAIVNVHYLAELVESHLRRRRRPPEIVVSDERKMLLDTGGGIRKALPAAR